MDQLTEAWPESQPALRLGSGIVWGEMEEMAKLDPDPVGSASPKPQRGLGQASLAPGAANNGTWGSDCDL